MPDAVLSSFWTCSDITPPFNDFLLIKIVITVHKKNMKYSGHSSFRRNRCVLYNIMGPIFRKRWNIRNKNRKIAETEILQARGGSTSEQVQYSRKRHPAGCR